jgi:hypothetical protein
MTRDGRRWPEEVSEREMERARELGERRAKAEARARAAAKADGKSIAETELEARRAGIDEIGVTPRPEFFLYPGEEYPGEEPDWRAVVISDSGQAWIHGSSGWEAKWGPGCTVHMQEMTWGDFREAYSDLRVPAWLYQRLKTPVKF